MYILVSALTKMCVMKSGKDCPCKVRERVCKTKRERESVKRIKREQRNSVFTLANELILSEFVDAKNVTHADKEAAVKGTESVRYVLDLSLLKKKKV